MFISEVSISINYEISIISFRLQRNILQLNVLG